MADVFLGALLGWLLERLTPDEYFLNYLGRMQGVEKKLKKWHAKLTAIEAVLYDAEEKQLTSLAVKQWLNDLKDLAYDIEDILDKFYTELLRRKIEEQRGRMITRKVRSLIPHVHFNFHMNSAIGEITDRLQDISDRKDQLGLLFVATPSAKAWQRPPSSSLVDGAVIGRDEDKRKIVEFLLRDEASAAVNFHVVAIVGMPGLGKTTLAGHVFHDDAMTKFDHKVWISVSDNFDLVRVTKAILESVKSESCDLKEFSKVQENLSKELANKKFLIVLDDVWSTCKYDLWTKLQSPFHVGAPGSKIIVTTREAQVAGMMKAVEIHNLEYISDDDSWKVFKQHAFLDVDIVRQQSFETYREKVVAKCGGLPLAAKALGGLLGFKEIDEWEEILENKLWSLSDNSGILPVLRLSYNYLSSKVKRCFAYCSILPNDYEFGRNQLILLWMAEGLIQQSQENKKMEDVGADYFGELLSKSLFQKSSKNDSLYVMHDLVGELARWAAEDTYFRLEDKSDGTSGSCSSKVRHSSYISGEFDGAKKFEQFFTLKRLRTFLPLSVPYYPFGGNYLTTKVTLDLLQKLEYLRVLSLNGYKIVELPDSIGHLKHIRYLDLSHTLILSLPESTCTLYNLQTLILEGCYRLTTLPKKMRNLTDLRHIKNSHVPSLEGMPAQLGRLTNLQTLHHFAVGKGNESGIREIGPLKHLQEKMCLSRLENVNDVQDGRRADLESKKGLDALQLEWRGTRENESKVLDVLKPHRKLKELTISGYGGSKFSSWVGDTSFADMTIVRLVNCEKCPLLPPLGQLSNLKELYISRMSKVESVGAEFYGKRSLPFPLLEILEFEEMQVWEGWLPYEGDQGSGVFAQLKRLFISKCPRLEGEIPENLPSLSKLMITSCEQLVVSISNYKQLCEIVIWDCKAVVHSGAVEFELLEDMQLSSISEFEIETESFMRGVRKVQSLEIRGCEGLTTSWQSESELLQYLVSVRRLTIEGNSHSQFELVQAMTSLQELQIFWCPNVVSFPGSGFPRSLNKLLIGRCSSLEYLVIPPSLRRIQIWECEKLKSVVGGEEASCLEFFEMVYCPSLTSVSFFGGRLPKALKNLVLSFCTKLESINGAFDDSMCLEKIRISCCGNLKSIPEGLSHLPNLQKLSILYCESLDSIPIHDQVKHNLNSLEFCYDQGFTSFLQEGLPPNLIALSIWGLKSCKPPLLEWGLHSLTSLRVLYISGDDPDGVSFPPEEMEMEMEMLLPESLVRLNIQGFPNLKKLSNKGFQFLTSLQSVHLQNCPKLASIPIPEEGLPLSLTQLTVIDCPLLEERCKAGSKGPRNYSYWPSIPHIPYIRIGD